MTVRLDEPPIPTYTAEVVTASRGLDLAILRITGYLDGRVIEPGMLQLPFVELGDSAALNLDETITIVGYPSFSSDPVGVTRGTITRFTAEARAGNRAWIRTNAVIPGTMSGGGAYNRDGKLIGIPTISPAVSGGEVVDCRVIQDTNQDNRADRNDACVPVGGFISALRPSELARGLVRAAALGIRSGEDLTPTPPETSSGDPTFSRLFFTTRVNEVGVPASVVSSVPSGTTSLYLFFDYANMVDGLTYELRVTIDDIAEPEYGLPPVTWSGGSRGSWYIGSSGTPWRNGMYTFSLFIEGRQVQQLSIRVGQDLGEIPSLSDIVFGLPGEDPTTLAGTGYVLPEGTAVQARFTYHNMTPDVTWTYIWYYEGAERARDSAPWDIATYGTQGTRTITAAAAEFLAGQYRLELYLDNALSATADFVVAGGAQGTTAQIFVAEGNPDGPVFRFATAEAGGAPAGVVRDELPTGTRQLYVFFNWNLLAPGTMWTRRWSVDGDMLFEVTEPWDAPTSGTNYYVGLDSVESLPDGTYEFSISIANVTLERAAVRVGLGQLPIEAFASAEGVRIAGRITDAETGRGIPGALFIVLKAEYSVEDFVWNQSQVLGMSLADSEGRFEVPILLPRGTAEEPLLYSVLVRAEGYLPVNADGITVIEDTVSPIEMEIALSRS
jgi:hypothetical protein